VKEGRQPEVDRWVDDLLDKLAEQLKQKAADLAADARRKGQESRGDVRKRSREENVFERGCERGESGIIRLFIIRCSALILRSCLRSFHESSSSIASGPVSRRGS
jgi:hypothetical protein